MNEQEFSDHILELVGMRKALDTVDFNNRVVALSSELTIARNAASRLRLARLIDDRLMAERINRARRMETPLNLPDPECRHGYTVEQVRAILGDRYNEFWAWGTGLTASLCQGRVCETPHGAAIPTVDVEQFLRGGRPLD